MRWNWPAAILISLVLGANLAPVIFPDGLPLGFRQEVSGVLSIGPQGLAEAEFTRIEDLQRLEWRGGALSPECADAGYAWPFLRKLPQPETDKAIGRRTFFGRFMAVPRLSKWQCKSRFRQGVRYFGFPRPRNYVIEELIEAQALRCSGVRLHNGKLYCGAQAASFSTHSG